jgi:DNA-binding HxlR family transcriptional regulator
MKPKPFCPVEATIKVVGGKWKPSILLQLKDGPCHFNELRRRLPAITQRMLTLQLRALEADGIVSRTIENTNPPMVHYAFTPLGLTLAPAIVALELWGEENLRG